MHTAPRWSKLLNGLSARALVVAVLWAMPVTGLVSAFNGLLEGPNFYAHRTVVVDSVHVETRTTRSSGRFGADDVREMVWVAWQLTDGAGHTRHGMSDFDRTAANPQLGRHGTPVPRPVCWHSPRLVPQKPNGGNRPLARPAHRCPTAQQNTHSGVPGPRPATWPLSISWATRR